MHDVPQSPEDKQLQGKASNAISSAKGRDEMLHMEFLGESCTEVAVPT
jgi:hypothetical protein